MYYFLSFQAWVGGWSFESERESGNSWGQVCATTLFLNCHPGKNTLNGTHVQCVYKQNSAITFHLSIYKGCPLHLYCQVQFELWKWLFLFILRFPNLQFEYKDPEANFNRSKVSQKCCLLAQVTGAFSVQGAVQLNCRRWFALIDWFES